MIIIDMRTCFPSLNYFETARFLQRIAKDPKAAADPVQIWKKLKRYQYSLFTMQTFGFPVRSVIGLSKKGCEAGTDAGMSDQIEKDDDPVIDYIFCEHTINVILRASHD